MRKRLCVGMRESERVAACVLEIYERRVTRSLGCIFLKFPHSKAKCIARRQTLLTNNAA